MRAALPIGCGSSFGLGGSEPTPDASSTRVYDPRMYYILFYDYVADVAQRREPHRAGHLSLLNAIHHDGKLVMAGAYTDPLDGAALIFTERQAAEAFVKADPYIANGLVSAHRIREWNVVVG